MRRTTNYEATETTTSSTPQALPITSGPSEQDLDRLGECYRRMHTANDALEASLKSGSWQRIGGAWVKVKR